MTDDTNDQASPQANVIPTEEITNADLSTMLRRFRADEPEPLIFGDDGEPEAAIIPFFVFRRFLDYEDQAAHADQTELTRRVRAAESSNDPGIDLDQLVDEIGEPARSALRKHRDDG